MYVTKRKRVVRLPNKEIDFGAWKLTDFIMPDSYASQSIFAEAWGRLSQFFAENPDYASKLERMIGLHNMVVKELWNVVNIEVKYRYDDPVFQTPDFWMLPNETWTQKKGDCEDTTFLLTSAVEGFLNTVKVDNKIFACMGFYIDPYSGQAFGHAFPIYKAEFYDGWLWLETTPETPVPQSVWYVWNPDYLVPVYFFNSKESYRIDRDFQRLGLTGDYVKKYNYLIRAMIDYVEEGVRLNYKFMHKGLRTPKMPEKIVLAGKCLRCKR